MSVLIRGMKMPKDCPMCPFAHWTKVTDEFTGCDIVGGKKYARIKDKEYANSSTRPDWCPLVELPEKHGDLIDRDALPFEYVQEVGLEGQMHCVVRSLPIKEAPVVIEAEGE